MLEQTEILRYPYLTNTVKNKRSKTYAMFLRAAGEVQTSPAKAAA